MGELKAAGHPTSGHPHSRLRRLLRRVDPRWWLARVEGWCDIEMVHARLNKGQAGLQEVDMMHNVHGVSIGTLTYQICDQCLLGYVVKISIDMDFQGQGLGTRAIDLVRRQAPAYRWCTSGQYRSAETFWQHIAGRTGDAYTADNDLHPCQHMERDSHTW